MKTQQNEQKDLPEFLTKNYYFLNPRDKAAHRREQEDKVNKKAADYFKSLDFEIEENFRGAITSTREFKGNEIKIYFHYQESTKNIYREFKVYKNGNKSNRKIIKTIAIYGRKEKLDQILN